MKSYKSLLVLFFIGISLFSCSKDASNSHDDLLGVWDYVEITAEETKTFRIVFGDANTGIYINKVAYATGEITSSAESIEWHKSNGVIKIDNEETYTINTQGQLVSGVSVELVLDKVSDDYSQFYESK